MITRHHVALTLLCSMIPAGIIFSFDPVLAVLVLTGTVIGSIMPDIHMHRSKSSVIRRIPWAIAQSGRLLCIPPMKIVYCRVFGINMDPLDKRITHSIPGILFYFFIIAGISGLLAVLFPSYIPITAAAGFSCGILTGMALHLAEDMCTKKGIYPAFPFSARCVAGSIRPCNTEDRRISEFHFLYATMAAGFLSITFPLGEPIIELMIGGSAVIVLCVGLMMYMSEIHVRVDIPLQAYNPNKIMG